MRKHIFFLLLFLLPFSTQAHASFIYSDDTVLQAETFTVETPAHNNVHVEGTFGDHELKFFRIQRTIDPNEPISRGEFLKLLLRNHTFPEAPSEEETFPDVRKNDTYFEYVSVAYNNDIIQGYDDGLFHPYDSLTRAQIAKILTHALPLSVQKDISPTFPDLADEHPLKYEVLRAVQTGLMNGYPDGMMRPDRSISYHEAILMVGRALRKDIAYVIHPREYFRAYAAPHRNDDLDDTELVVKAFNQTTGWNEYNKTVHVDARKYRNVSFSLPADRDALFSQELLDETWELINNSKANPEPFHLWTGTFDNPTPGARLTSQFGDKMRINGTYRGSHFGLDYAAATGTLIYAPNNAKVVLSQMTPSYGNVVVLDHGMNVFTMYLHMDALHRNVGDIVKKGDDIGTIGNTGISNGPHLHYTHFVGDVVVDNVQWYNEEL